MRQHPNASYSVTLRIETRGDPGTLGRITTVIGETGGVIGTIDLIRVGGGINIRDISVAARDPEHEALIVRAVESLDCVRVTEVFDRTFQVHLGGCGKRRCAPRSTIRRGAHRFGAERERHPGRSSHAPHAGRHAELAGYNTPGDQQHDGIGPRHTPSD